MSLGRPRRQTQDKNWETLQLILHKYYYEQSHANKLYNIDEKDKFLEISELPKLNHEVENLNRPLTCKEIESLIKNLPSTTTKNPRTRWLHW